LPRPACCFARQRPDRELMGRPTDQRRAAPDLPRIARRLAPYLRPRWHGLVLAGFGMLGHTVIDLAKPWPLKLVFDALLGVRTGPLGTSLDTVADQATFLAGVSAAIIGIALLDGLFRFWQEHSLKRAAHELAFDMRAALFAHIQRLSLDIHQRQRTGDLITRVTGDIDIIEDFLTKSLLRIVGSLLVVAGMFAVMLWMDWLLALAAFVLVPFLLGLIYRFTARIKQFSRFQRKEEGSLASHAQEAISAIRVVKAYTREEHESEQFRRAGQRSLEAGLRVSRLEAQFGWAADVVGALGTAAVVVLGTLRALAGQISPGDLVVFTTYLRRLYQPVRDFVKEISKVQKALVRAERVVAVFEIDPGVSDEPDARPAPRLRGAIRFEGVSFAYLPGQPVLQDLSFEVEPGQTVALVGPTGAGKTTLAALIPRFYDVMAGRVEIDETDVRRYTLRSLRSQISLVLQETMLFHATIAENIAYGNPAAGMSDVVAAAQAAHADEFISALPRGYDTIVSERGASLSGGQRQRIAIARAVIRNAPIVILDEPTTGLDAGTEVLVLDALARLTAGRTTIVIAHDLTMAARADLILVLDGGRVVERGTHDELMGLRGCYFRLACLQARGHEQPNAKQGLLSGAPLPLG
jgi:ATP-binding cassette subfamily B protein